MSRKRKIVHCGDRTYLFSECPLDKMEDCFDWFGSEQ